MSLTWKQMPADRSEFTHFLEIKVMGHCEILQIGFNQVECVFIALPPFAATRSGGAALDNDDAAVSMVPRKKVKRASDIGSVQMPPQNHFDFLLDKAVNGAPCARHRYIEHSVVPGRELMVRNNYTDNLVGHTGESLCAVPELMQIESAIGDAPPWSG